MMDRLVCRWICVVPLKNRRVRLCLISISNSCLPQRGTVKWLVLDAGEEWRSEIGVFIV